MIVPYKEREIWRHTETDTQGKRPNQKEARIEAMQLQTSEGQGGSHDTSSLRHSRNNQPCRHLELGFLVSAAVRREVSVGLSH